MATIPIYAFSTGNKADLASNKYVSGTTLTYYWSQLQPKNAPPTFDIIDHDMKPWVDAGKGVILRVATSGWKSWQPPYSVQGTPQWVFDQGVRHVKETDGAIKPEYWAPKFLQALNAFIVAFAARYGSNANIVLIEVAIGDGGETKVDTRKNPKALKMWQGIGYSDQTWWKTIQTIALMYKTAFTSKPLAIMPDNSFIGGTKGYGESLVLGFAAAHGFVLQNNGLVNGEVLKDPSWKHTKIIDEQRDKLAQG
ncbi:MAG: hypothetical protein EPO08_21305, partial [Rhodospirillaceae bacterium]